MTKTKVTRAERQLIALEAGMRSIRKQLSTMIREIDPKSRHAVKDIKLSNTERRGLGSPEKDCEDANVQMTLGLFTFDANHAYPPSMTLNPIPKGVWAQIRRIMHNNGGEWCSKGYFKFDCDATALFDGLLKGKLANQKKDRQAFYTPPELADKVVGYAGFMDGDVLEPSAGDGALADACKRAGAMRVVCYEIEPTAAARLIEKGYMTYIGDFLATIVSRTYQSIVMNPPFARDAYIKHILHALNFLKKGGRLVAVIPGHQPSEKLMRAIPAGCVCNWYDQGKGVFKASGTNIGVSILVIQK